MAEIVATDHYSYQNHRGKWGYEKQIGHYPDEAEGSTKIGAEEDRKATHGPLHGNNHRKGHDHYQDANKPLEAST
jgi:hypothetical protein